MWLVVSQILPQTIQQLYLTHNCFRSEPPGILTIAWVVGFNAFLFQSFYWNIVDLQYCLDFNCTSKWFIYIGLGWPKSSFGFLHNMHGFPRWLGGKESTCNVGTAGDTGLIPGLERSPGEGNATQFSILAWRIPWTKKPAGLWSTGSQRVGHNRSNLVCTHACNLHIQHICTDVG